MDKYIRQFLKYITLERRYSPNTVTSYSTDLEQLESFCKSYFNLQVVYWNKIDKTILRHFMITLQEQGIGRRSIARKLAAIKSFFKYLVREEIIAANSALSIKMPKFEKRLPEFIPLPQIEQILTLPQIRTFEGLRDLAILELLYGTGIRLSE